MSAGDAPAPGGGPPSTARSGPSAGAPPGGSPPPAADPTVRSAPALAGDPDAPLLLGVLASGAGTNLQAILDRVHGREAEVVAVGSDKPGCEALARARRMDIATAAFPAAEHPSREARDLAMATWLVDLGVEVVVLAGYMQLVSEAFLAAFPQRVINVHPALLPAFPGLRAIEQALDYGVKVAGVTVHFVDEGMDSGPIIAQRAVELPAGASVDQVRALLRPIEHDLLTGTIALLARGAVHPDPEHPRRVLVDA
jgi:phosphoribosylglycinamide formyltransferase-1